MADEPRDGEAVRRGLMELAAQMIQESEKLQAMAQEALDVRNKLKELAGPMMQESDKLRKMAQEVADEARRMGEDQDS